MNHLLPILLLALAAVEVEPTSAKSDASTGDASATADSTSAALAAAAAESLLSLARASTQDREEAIRLVEEAIAVGRRAEHPLLLAESTSVLARLYERSRDYPTAIAKYQEAAGLAELAGRSDLAIRDRIRGAGLMVEIGRLAEGLEVLEAAKSVAGASEDRASLADVLYNLARTHQRAGDLDAALSDCREISRLDAEHGLELRARSRGHLVQARVLKDMGRLHESLDILEVLEVDADSLGGNWPAIVLTTRANVLLDLGDLQSSLERYRQVREFAIANDDRLRIAIAEGNIAGCYTRLGRYQDALESYRRCGEIFEQLGHAPNLALTRLNLANVHLRLGNLESALAEAERARATFADSGMRAREISAQLTIADIQLERGHLETARAATESGLNQAEAEGIERDVLRALFSLGKIDAIRGELDAAAASMDAILVRTERSGELLQRSRALSILGEIELARGREQVAESHLVRAVELASELDSPRYAVIPLVDLGRCLRGQGRTDEALARFRDAIEHVERIRWGTGAESERWSVFGQNLDPYAEAARSLIDAERWDEAFAMVELSRARTLLDRLSQLDVDLDARVPAELRRERNENLARTSFVRSRAMGSTGGDRDALLQELDQLDAAYERIEGRIRQRQNPLSDLRRLEPAGVESVREHLPPHAVLLEYIFLEGGAWCFTIVPGAPTSVRALPAGLVEQVIELRAILERGRHPRDLDLDRSAELQVELYRELVGRSIETLPFAVESIVLAPDGPLWSLPFEVLLTRPVEGEVTADSLGRLPYLFREVDLHIIPSATVWLRLGKARVSPARADRPVLILADPEYGATRDPGSSTSAPIPAPARDPDVEPRRGDFMPLPHAGEEARRIAEAWGESRARVHLGREASEDRLKSEDLDRYGGLHFATHSHIDPEHPQRTAVVLALDSDPAEDGLLTLREIYGLHLDADLVVLSTCSSAGGRALQGEGVIALVRAFLAVGARSALVSLWPVEDRSTSEFMAAFHSHWATGSSPEEAVRAARFSLLESARPAWRLPYHWAPFVLVGGP